MPPPLSFEQAPSFSVPLRFFLTAPLFGVAAGILLLFSGDAVLVSRWQPSTLALTHLFVAGFLLQVMVGALFQFVPVVTGGNVRWPRLMASAIHPALTLGAILLVLAFLQSAPGLFTGAALALGIGLAYAVAAIGTALVGNPGKGDTLSALRGALLGLLITAGLGVSLALVLGGRLSADVPRLLEAHQAWGLGGWALLLLAGVSWSVVPMFQITPPYPRRITRAFTGLVLGALVMISLGLIREWLLLARIGEGLLIVAAAVFAAGTLRLQAQRKRKTADDTLLFFRVAMVALLAACLVGLGLAAAPDAESAPRWTVALGVLLIFGGFGSAVCGMLYKIVPFLVWLHLRDLATRGAPPPNMNQVIAARPRRRQLWTHLTAFALLLTLPWLPRLTPLAGLAVIASFGGLWINLLMALKTYRAFRARNSADSSAARA